MKGPRVPSPPPLPGDHTVKRLLKEGSLEARLSLLRHPQASLWMVQAALEDPHPEVREEARRLLAPETTTPRLAESLLEERGALEDAPLLGGILANPDPEVRLVLAKKRQAPRWVLERLAQDPDPRVAKAAGRILERGLWRYASTLARRYGLTRHQIQEAVRLGLLEGREVVNPHYRSASPALLVREEELEAKLGAVRGLPKEPPEALEARQVYRKRSQIRRLLRFFCPRCKEEVRPRPDSTALEDALEGYLSPEQARKLLLLAHYRHRHTGYEAFLQNPLGYAFPREVALLRRSQEDLRLARHRFHSAPKREQPVLGPSVLLGSGGLPPAPPGPGRTPWSLLPPFPSLEPTPGLQDRPGGGSPSGSFGAGEP